MTFQEEWSPWIKQYTNVLAYFTLRWRCLAEERVSSRQKTSPEIPKSQFWEMQSKGPFTLCADTCRSVQMHMCVDTRVSTVTELAESNDVFTLCTDLLVSTNLHSTCTNWAFIHLWRVLTAWCHASAVYAVVVCLSVCHKLVFYLGS